MPPKQNQNGGARPFIRDLVPGVTSPDTMEEQMDFFLVSGHGVTDTKRLMIVPDNTFLLFVSESAFIRDVRMESEKMAKLVSPLGYLGPDATPDANQRAQIVKERKKDLYESFVVGGSRAFHFYARSMVYCPGDILPDTRITFESGKQYIAWSKGVYRLPVTDRTHFLEFTGWMNATYKLSSLVEKGIADKAYMEPLLKSEKREEFLQMGKMSYKEWVGLYPYETDFTEYFKDVDGAVRILNEALYDYFPENLAKESGMPNGGNYLSEILHKIPSPKSARFFIFTGCRGPMFASDQPNATFGYELAGAEPVNFPRQLTAAPLRKLQRRFSFSVKCVTPRGAPAMNLESVRAAYLQLLTSPNFAQHLHKPHNAAASAFITFLQMSLFIGPKTGYTASTPITNLGLFLTYAYSAVPEETLSDMPLYEELRATIRDSFGEFTRLLRREVEFDTKGLTMEEVLLRFSGFDYTKAIPFVRNEAAAGSVRSEAILHSAANRAERAAFEKEAEGFLNVMQESYEKLNYFIKDSLKSAREYLRGMNVSEVDTFNNTVERVYINLLDSGRQMRDSFQSGRARIFFQYRGLREADRSDMERAYAELSRKFDEFPKLVAPYKELLEEAKARRNAKGGGKRGRTRRLRR